MNPISKIITAAKEAVVGKKPAKTPNQIPMGQVIVASAIDRWGGQTARTYTPEKVEQVLRGAMSGNIEDQWRLFDLMEDTAPRINKNLNQRKRAVMSFIRTFNAWADEDAPAAPEAEQRKRVVSSAIWGMKPKADKNENGFDDTIYDILDAVGKGVSLLEIDWEMRNAGKLGLIAAPRATRYIYPRYYGYPPTQDWLGLNIPAINQARSTSGTGTNGSGNQPQTLNLDLSLVDGIYARIPENKFLVCTYRGKSGHPTGTALLRRLAFWWAASNFSQSWFLNFAQIFGLPIRWANYDPNTPGLLEKVCSMLENMGSAAWGAFPAGTSLELKEPPKNSSENPQVVLLDRADKQYDLLILGQSGTTEIAGPGKSGGSNAANEVLQGVEKEIVRSDAKFVCKIFNEQLIPMIIWLNYTDDQMMPELALEPEVIEDIGGLVENYKTATDAGVITPNKDDEIHFRKKLSLPAMNKDVESDWTGSKGVRQPPAKTSTGPGMPGGDVAMAHAHANEAGDTTSLVDAALADATGIAPRWLGAVRPIFEELIAKAKAGDVTDAEFITAIDDARSKLPDVFDKLDHNSLARVIEQTMGAAVVNGAVKGAMRRKAVAA